MKMRNIFILGYFGYYNLGDDLMIDILMGINIGGIRKVVLTRRKYYKKKCDYINRYNLIKYFFSIKRDDILINLGGIFQDKTSSLSFYYYYIMNLIFLWRRGKITFINTEFLDVNKFMKQVSFLLRKSCLTILRSKRQYNKYYKKYRNLYYCPDLAFLYDSGKNYKKRTGKPYILISLRTHNRLDKIIFHLSQINKKCIFLVMKNEKKIIDHIQQYFTDKSIVTYNYFNCADIIDLIKRAQSIITMRYHIGILGLLFRKHIQVILQDNKMTILSDDFGVPLFRCNKKMIDKPVKNQYINKAVIKRLWNDFFRKIINI